MSNYKYRARLVFDGLDSVNIPSIDDARNGFWINQELEFTRGEDGVRWLPPHAIKYVDKIVDEKVE